MNAYFIISSEFFPHLKDFEILNIDISDHFPLLHIMRSSSVESMTKMLKNHSDARPRQDLDGELKVRGIFCKDYLTY